MKRIVTKKDDNRIVEIAEKEIEKFAKEWMTTPYAWESETDVHAELYIRIKSSLRSKKFPLVKYKYKGMVGEEYFDWIYCGPKTYVEGANYPDLVIYKNTGKKRNVGDRENEPMLWVCEIKYLTEWSSNFTVDSIKKDVKKLQKLLKQKADGTGTDHACILILVRWLKKYKTNKIPKKKKLIEIDEYLKTLEGKGIKLKVYYGEKVINNNE